ncbi:hypothetical protein [Novosphingobium profundi]|uniref:hypothetical protein n=1 Tax=Novosphingobium profundi TaxID=1774954 RepID=UPI001CFD7B33|nr:hypothetical protein [Novosphingobium profundi]
MPYTKPLVLAVSASFLLGGLTGAVMPTRMKAPIGPDWRDKYNAPLQVDSPSFYVEPGPQDLTPARAEVEAPIGITPAVAMDIPAEPVETAQLASR